MRFRLPTVVASLKGERALLLKGLRQTRRALNWDARFYEASIQLAPAGEPTNALIALSGSFAATWEHPSQTLGWHVPIQEALPGLTIIALGEMLDEDELGSPDHDKIVVPIDTYHVFERAPADDEVVQQFLRGHVYWSWRFGLPHAHLSEAEAARLGLNFSTLIQVTHVNEDLFWQREGEDGLKPLPVLLRDFGQNLRDKSKPKASSHDVARRFEVALSFAGEQRELARSVAKALRDRDVDVFYDEFHKSELWGQDLASLLGDIYGDRSRYVIIFVSEAYLAKPWTEHERQHALSGRIKRMDASVLPIRLDDSSLPGLPGSVGYLDGRSMSAVEIAELMCPKLEHDRHGEQRLDSR